MKLTRNEKEVLKLLLDNGRVSDIEMAKNLKISTQAIGKIRKKLEADGIIDGYSCNISYEKLGLNIFALALIKLKDKFWEDKGEMESFEIVKKVPHIFACMLPGYDVSLISLHAFRDMKELDRYFHLAKARNVAHQEVSRVYSFSALNILKNSPKDVIKLVLDEKPIVP